MKRTPNISEAEWPIMEVLWKQETATAAEIVIEVTRRRSVAMRTVKTLIRRLIAKDMVTFTVDEHDSRIYHYRPLISKETAAANKNLSLLSSVYNNNIGELLANFVRNADLTEAEIKQLQKLLKEKQREGDHG